LRFAACNENGADKDSQTYGARKSDQYRYGVAATPRRQRRAKRLRRSQVERRTRRRLGPDCDCDSAGLFLFAGCRPFPLDVVWHRAASLAREGCNLLGV